MMEYLLKAVVCSAFFLGIYYVLLEKAKMPRFNRVYLLLAVIASFIIPLITFTTSVIVFPMPETPASARVMQEPLMLMAPVEPPKTDLIPFIMTGIYFLVAGLLLLRSIINITRLFALVRHNRVIVYKKAKIILLKKQITPFSFFNYVFVNESDYTSGRIEDEVMHHELEHGRQKHTLDIIIIELLNSVAWFNPLLPLYRKAIQLNHEFLADDAVISRFNDPVAYQFLLLNAICRSRQRYAISSPFSYNITKKRLVMITNPFNRRTNMARALAIIPVTVLAVFIFSGKTVAQIAAPGRAADTAGNAQNPATAFAPDTVKKLKTTMPHAFPLVGGTKEGIPEELLNEYLGIVEKYAYTSSKGFRDFKQFSQEDKKKLKEIFMRMSLDQQVKQEIVFYEPMKPLSRNVPSEEQMQSFLDRSKYGVWIDNKKAANASLADYKNTDFSHVMISKLYGKAKEGRSYTHQVNLMTNAAFESANARIRANKEPRMAIMVRPNRDQQWMKLAH